MDKCALILRARLKEEKKVEIPLAGRCMYPLLKEGDFGLFKPVDKVHIGRIYLCELSSGRLVVHRCVGREGDFVFVKGDFSHAQEKLNSSQIVAELSGLALRGAYHVSYKPRKTRDKVMAYLSHSLGPMNNERMLYKKFAKTGIVLYGYVQRFCLLLLAALS